MSEKLELAERSYAEHVYDMVCDCGGIEEVYDEKHDTWGPGCGCDKKKMKLRMEKYIEQLKKELLDD